MDIIKQNISSTTSIPTLNKITQSSICSIFNTNTSKIVLLQDNSNFPELITYFSRSIGEKIFINDIVFIEENKSKFDKNIIRQEVDSSTMLVFPIFKSESEIIGLFFIGKKPFGDFYTIDEISALLSFVKFLGLHLKYISTYTKIQEYSMTLDMRIDKKTIEYNDLINQQKEFISMISHEVRSPIGSAVFQIDSLIDDIRINKNISLDEISENLKAIGEQITNIGELLRKLFSVQYFDTRKVVLLKENIDIGLLLEKEFDIYSHMYQNITFIKKISTQIGCVDIDKIHFQQVLTNLLENAIKFANPEEPVILIELSEGLNNTFLINIEDNGSGYGEMDPSLIFEKYSKGNHAKLGLGMGLYLCKR
ncbi:HAMP domain-containing histidine kinase, partial [Candidatus Gracilibacteria bacterium]|nr:HAMP domain-containing histidine kinase [Candidatus Gracilibacteria bacterium]